MSTSEKEDLYFAKKKEEDIVNRDKTRGFKLNLYSIEERQEVVEKRERKQRIEEEEMRQKLEAKRKIEEKMARQLKKRLAKASSMNIGFDDSDSNKEHDVDDDFAVGARVHVRLMDEIGEPTSPEFVPMSKELVE